MQVCGSAQDPRESAQLRVSEGKENVAPKQFISIENAERRAGTSLKPIVIGPIRRETFHMWRRAPAKKKIGQTTY